MHKLALAVVLALGAAGVQAAQAQNMTLQSEEISDGATIQDEQVAAPAVISSGLRGRMPCWASA